MNKEFQLWAYGRVGEESYHVSLKSPSLILSACKVLLFWLVGFAFVWLRLPPPRSGKSERARLSVRSFVVSYARQSKLPMVNHKYFMLIDVKLAVVWWYHDKSKNWYRSIDGLEPITYMPRRGQGAPDEAPLPSVFFMELRLCAVVFWVHVLAHSHSRS